ncbi:Panacea domain-containing protein [Pseudomonas oryzihabitans]|uniref:Panacea domain-containing protein n=1 Tax=Pseudomonas oryzihabitans TaxID=47885 RepID=UPI00241D3280|nr:type II toxin-antitoxin system antitoxin SocA domain-containing protein [Pseudomonas oryzihabitans]
MAYSALAVANAFIKRAQEGKLKQLTPMKLQKLLFYVQSWYFRTHGKPLFDDNFSRWTHGPVIPSIYHEFKMYGSGEIKSPGAMLSPIPGGTGSLNLQLVTPDIDDGDADAVAFIEETIRVYGQYSGWELSVMTHQPGTAWSLGGGGDGGAMSLAEMAAHIHPESAPTSASTVNS